MTRITVLFLGAGKLWQLMHCFQQDAAALGVELNLHSMELDPYCPIAEMVTVHEGPKFSEDTAADAVLDLARKINADLILPCMDTATIVLAKLRTALARIGAHAVVSDLGLCNTMHDKMASDSWFDDHGDARPLPSTIAPVIAKDRFGYASRGIYILLTQAEVDAFVARDDIDRYLLQNYIEGDEYTVDAYVSRDGRVVDILSRKRLVVEAGIVLNSETQWHEDIICKTKTILSRPGWQGAITLQFRIDANNDYKIIEINPRMGGGVTHSIHCGLRMPKWLIQEHLGQNVQHEPYIWPRRNLMTRARVDIFHDHRS